MAIKKETMFKGVIAEYHRIFTVYSSADSNSTYVQVALYKDRATRQTNPNNYLELYAVTIPAVDLTRKDIYTHLMTLDRFINAVEE